MIQASFLDALAPSRDTALAELQGLSPACERRIEWATTPTPRS